MRKRQRIEKSPDSSNRSVELRSVSRQFCLAHGASTMINLVSIVATVWHCAYLGDRMVL
ncbi:MAG: hypothetical protein BJ554DRAFT_4915 [Olpidium bornovanus]|uniref:Uncharacterized protein n=1 Tax=Olpidium bornovanus TaxID=278681 RepID=A0A8H8A017_9FUNG|nr:MAG: hypothetical protein BJ554DRAFT_4915 [Olpidium bornovanus]